MIIKKYILFFSIFFNILCAHIQQSAALLNEGNIDPKGSSIIKNSVSQTGTDGIFLSLVNFKEFLFNILVIIVIGSFLYIGYRFVSARGNPEEFKKAWMHTLYIIVGIAVTSSAWGIVKLVTDIDF